MEYRESFSEQNQKPGKASRSAPVADLREARTASAPFAEEVAKRAYFTYLNQGSQPGHDLRHWLEAEQQLYAERKINTGLSFPRPNREQRS